MRNLLYIIFILLNSFLAKSQDTLNKNITNQLISWEISEHEDYCNYRYISKSRARMDEQIVFPKHFEIKLPKGIFRIKGIGFNVFFFHLHHKEIIVVRVTDKKDAYPTDAISNDNAGNYLLDFGLEEKYIKPKRDKKRKSFFVKGNGMFILLYNIKTENVRKYIELVNQHYFL